MKLLQKINRRLQRELVPREGRVTRKKQAWMLNIHRALVAPNTANMRHSSSLSIWPLCMQIKRGGSLNSVTLWSPRYLLWDTPEMNITKRTLQGRPISGIRIQDGHFTSHKCPALKIKVIMSSVFRGKQFQPKSKQLPVRRRPWTVKPQLSYYGGKDNQEQCINTCKTPWSFHKLRES